MFVGPGSSRLAARARANNVGSEEVAAGGLREAGGADAPSLGAFAYNLSPTRTLPRSTRRNGRARARYLSDSFALDSLDPIPCRVAVAPSRGARG